MEKLRSGRYSHSGAEGSGRKSAQPQGSSGKSAEWSAQSGAAGTQKSEKVKGEPLWVKE